MSLETSNDSIINITDNLMLPISAPRIEKQPDVTLDELALLEESYRQTLSVTGQLALTHYSDPDYGDVVPNQSKLVAERPWLGPILARMKPSDWA
jgi:hypothetical protein